MSQLDSDELAALLSDQSQDEDEMLNELVQAMNDDPSMSELVKEIESQMPRNSSKLQLQESAISDRQQSGQIPSGQTTLEFKSSGKKKLRDSTQSIPVIEGDQTRYIILIDMDAYYAQVEMKKHNLDHTKPMAVQQWNSIIALNYPAKAMGVKRSMTVYEALSACQELTLVHVSTFEVTEYTEMAQKIFTDKIIDPSKTKRGAFGLMGEGTINLLVKEQVGVNQDASDFDQMSESSDDAGGVGQNFIPSSICETKVLSNDPNLEPYRRFWVKMRQKQNQKVSLKLYRHESKKIFRILQRFSDNVEKASCDEAFLDVTQQVNIRFSLSSDQDFDDLWHNSRFMGHDLGVGQFKPESEEEKKLFLANEIALQVRQQIKTELGYNASAGISHNKTVAKIACGENKPNGQTVVPRRYFKIALASVPIKNIRMLGGKLGKQLRDQGFETMGDIQFVELDDLVPIVGGQAQWIYDLARGICNENVSEKLAPKSASAIKTFKEIFSLEKILKQVCLVCSDLIEKIKEHMRDKNVYPCSLVLTQRRVIWSRNAEEMKSNSFRLTIKMVPWDEFTADPQCMMGFVTKQFQQHEAELPFPARMVGITCQNFKPIDKVKLPTRKIDNIFKSIDATIGKDAALRRKEEEQKKMNEQIKESKLKKRRLEEEVKEEQPSKRGGKKKLSGKFEGCSKLTSFFKRKE